MTKPETEWVLVPREPLVQVCDYTKAMTGVEGPFKNQLAMLAAAPPAPSVGDVVADWNHSVAARSVELMARDGDRMAAALTEQAKELQQAAQAGIDFGVKLAAERATVTELRAEAEAARETLEDEQAAHRDTLRLLSEKCACRFVDNAPVQRCAIHQMHHDLACRTEAAEADKDDAYAQRNHVVAVLARLYPSGIGRTDIPGWMPEWHGCVYIDLPTGQISYHFHDREAALFADLPPYTKAWDGHDKDAVHARLAQIGNVPTPGGALVALVMERCAKLALAIKVKHPVNLVLRGHNNACDDVAAYIRKKAVDGDDA